MHAQFIFLGLSKAQWEQRHIDIKQRLAFAFRIPTSTMYVLFVSELPGGQGVRVDILLDNIFSLQYALTIAEALVDGIVTFPMLGSDVSVHATAKVCLDSQPCLPTYSTASKEDRMGFIAIPIVAIIIVLTVLGVLLYVRRKNSRPVSADPDDIIKPVGELGKGRSGKVNLLFIRHTGSSTNMQTLSNATAPPPPFLTKPDNIDADHLTEPFFEDSFLSSHLRRFSETLSEDSREDSV